MTRFLLLLSCFLVSFLLTAQTALTGKVVNEDENNEVLISAPVSLYKDGVFSQGTLTDFDGNYFFSNIDPGTYDVEVNYTGLKPVRLTGIPVKAGQTNVANVTMTSDGGVDLTTVEVIGFKVPLIEQDNTTSGQTVTSEQIRNLPTRNVNEIASIAAGASSADQGEEIAIRGSRPNGTDYYIDGIRVSGASAMIADSEIEQLQIITGGVEARYGDVTGGIINVTSKGPSNTFNINAEAETSEGLDAFGNSLAGLGVSGPILRNSQGNSVLGYRFYGRYTLREDDDPSAVDIFRINDERLAELQANPLIVRGGRPFVAADFLTNDDVLPLQTRPFEERASYQLNGKLDARLTDDIDISLIGYYANSENQFTPSENSVGNSSWRLLNAQNNPFQDQEDYRVNFRFRHRIGGASGGASRSLIQNASYDLAFGYENNKNLIDDSRHGDRFFDYGYVGTFDVDWIPIYSLDIDPVTGGVLGVNHEDYRAVLRGYDASTSRNPVLSNYNNIYGLSGDSRLNSDFFGTTNQPSDAGTAVGLGGIPVPMTADGFFAANGQTQNVFNNSYNFHTNVGTVFNLFRQEEDEIYTFQANANFELIPGSSDKSRHSIQLGVLYEQRTNRDYNLNPRGLWLTGRQLINQHLNVVQEGNRVVGSIDVDVSQGSLNYSGPADILAPTIEDNGGTFFRRVRERLGAPVDQYVNIDGLQPEDLSLDLFSAEELTFADLLSYNGYDYLGNKYDGSFDDFFAIDPETGRRSFNVGPNRPIYTAAYLQDKFTINKMIFRLGVRIDRYDANTKVLKDPYSLYEIAGAGDFHANFGGERPGNIGDDFAVYTTAQGNSEVRAYRSGDDWFQADGTPVNGPLEIEGIRTGIAFPSYANPLVSEFPNFIKEEQFTVETSFEDYEVQFNVMPRLAFSFPISDDANFFAHYDILAQRPPSNTIATPLDYFFFVERPGSGTDPINNPALRPERTIDYEVGFQQKLSNTSAIKLSAYYKELRDMIQLRTYFPVPLVNQYTTFDNQDFGTVKGFSFTYDLRRTSNVQINANYTLQFADGTGSDSESQQGLTNRGNLRTLFPLNFDERHRFNLVMDYRLGDNAAISALKNFGINLQGTAVSGRPYTAKSVPQPLDATGTIGAINGARNPFNITLNGQIDKDFYISGSRVNIYFRVSNILDRRNTVEVYELTGRPDDPGYLQSSFGEDQLQTIANGTRPVESFLASYQWRILNPDYFTLPRRMFVGARFSL